MKNEEFAAANEYLTFFTIHARLFFILHSSFFIFFITFAPL